MTETTPPDVPVQPARRSLIERISIVWVVPLTALVIALAVAWHSYADQGPLIEISFDSAAGVKANETELRYRDVPVGLVEKVSFSDALERVVVSVRLDKDIADYVDDSAEFWVVRPEVNTQGVTGLDTVLSGVFIQGIWDSSAEGLKPAFEGRTEAPLNREGREGLRIRLRAANDAGLSEQVPIVYRGIEVGQVGRAVVSADGATVEAEAIIYAPHDRLISSSTRFWDTSGFSFSLGPGGAEIDFSSVSSLIRGGVTFQTVVSGGEPASGGDIFTVYPDEGAARSSLFGDNDGSGRALNVTAIFEENVAGLSVDAPVDLGGVRVGRVTALNGIVDRDRFGDNRVRLAAELRIRPSKLGLERGATPDEALDFLRDQVAQGMRARLVTASIFTGGLKVELLTVENAAPAEIRTEDGANPVIPTTASEIADVSATAEGVFERINALPVEELMQSAIGVMDNVSRLVGSEDIRAVLGEVRGLLGEARGFVGNEDLQALPGELSQTVAQLRQLTAQLNEQDVVGRLVAAVDTINTTVGSFGAAAEGVQPLMDRLNAIAAKAEQVPLDQLATDLDALLQSADALIDTDAARALPADLSAALDELRQLVGEMREGGLVENANQTLASARQAADNIASAAEDLPALLDRTQALLTQAGSTLRTYDGRDGVGRDVTRALREVERAAAAVDSLSRAIERNPNSLLFGR
ncbi:MlaD family protein [Maritimibacter alkaliphilus]|uniref:MlaD family protein n=1 Tax=Maritimibacter alkaliphilus TaxID=404236 RepID=UPI001C977DE8|nr:MlaD family protein [Maritimibacter alkaliphilus]MBY6092195.1 MCE family protein [Maritimibacter alkaliphilus]